MEGYGGWAFRMEIVPIESAYPGFGELVVSNVYINSFLTMVATSKTVWFLLERMMKQVLESTDHINSCKPLSRSDPSYTEALQFLRKLSSQRSRSNVKPEAGMHD